MKRGEEVSVSWGQVGVARHPFPDLKLKARLVWRAHCLVSGCRQLRMNIPAISWYRYDIVFQVAQVAVEIQAGVITVLYVRNIHWVNRGGLDQGLIYSAFALVSESRLLTLQFIWERTVDRQPHYKERGREPKGQDSERACRLWQQAWTLNSSEELQFAHFLGTLVSPSIKPGRWYLAPTIHGDEMTVEIPAHGALRVPVLGGVRGRRESCRKNTLQPLQRKTLVL